MNEKLFYARGYFFDTIGNFLLYMCIHFELNVYMNDDDNFFNR